MNKSQCKQLALIMPSGFTLVELMVATGVILILIALILPAVQQAREAARRIQCRNNLKQLGLALHNYNDTSNCLPVGALGSISAPNWRIFLLPHLGQATLYNKLDFLVWKTENNKGGFASGVGGYGSEGNSILRGLSIPVYMCPSSTLGSNENFTMGPSANSNDDFGQLHHYIGIMGATPDPGGAKNTCSVQTGYGGVFCNNGMMIPNKVIRFRDCTDGLSNTIVIAEQSGPLAMHLDLRNMYLGGWAGFTSNGGGTYWDFADPATLLPVHTAFGVGTTAVRYPNNMHAAFLSDIPVGANETWDANTILTSEHGDGVNCLMSDGSVRYVVDQIGFETAFQRLCTRNDALATP